MLRSYYEDSGEDAFLMQYRLADDTGDEVEESGQPHRPVRGELTDSVAGNPPLARSASEGEKPSLALRANSYSGSLYGLRYS